MSNWQKLRIGDFANTYAGGTPARGNQLFFGGNIPWVKSTEVNQGKIFNTEETITETGLSSSSAKWIPANTVLVALYGATAAQIGFLKFKATSNQAVLAIIPTSQIDSYYLYYSLLSAKAKLLFLAQGSGQPNLNKQIVDNLKLDIPPLPQQRKIAKILTTVDNLIEKTEALIAKYQSIKQGMMHDLFTRGVDAKGKLRPPQSAAPELYKQSELGWIPKEWEVMHLGDALARLGGFLQTGPFGSQLHSYEYVSEGIPVIMPQDIISGEILENNIARITIQKTNSLARHRVRQNDVVFSRRGELSRVAAISTKEEGWVCGTGCFLLRCPVKYMDSQWLARQYRLPHVQKQVDAKAVGSTMPSLNNNVMAGLVMIFTNNDEQVAIGNKIMALEKYCHNQNNYLIKLRLQKTALMQDLLTGKVQVTPDAEDKE